MKDLSQKLGGRIRYFRAGAGMSQSALAQASGFTNGYLSDVERGKVNISINNLNSLADALNVPLAALLDCDPDEAAPTMPALCAMLTTLPDDALRALYQVALLMPRTVRTPE